MSYTLSDHCNKAVQMYTFKEQMFHDRKRILNQKKVTLQHPAFQRGKSIPEFDIKCSKIR